MKTEIFFRVKKSLGKNFSTENFCDMAEIFSQQKTNVGSKAITQRSSLLRCSMKNDVLRNFTKFTAKHLCQSVFFNKIAGLRPATLLKKRLWHRYFPVNFAKFLRTPSSTEHLWTTASEHNYYQLMKIIF